jgi:hypothetical protein
MSLWVSLTVVKPLNPAPEINDEYAVNIPPDQNLYFFILVCLLLL